MIETSNSIVTPYHMIDVDQLNRNILTLSYLKNKTKCKILFAVKGYSNKLIFPYMSKNFDGIAASSLFETKLAYNHFGKEVHTLSSVYKPDEIDNITKYSDYVIFNSLNQLRTFYCICRKESNIGIRINPNYSEIKNYNINPCHEYSRFGISANNIEQILNFKIKYIHLHTMCEQFSDTLERTLDIVGEKFARYLNYAQWVNIGGGQLFTDDNYDLEHAIRCINKFKEEYDVDLYLEPCEAVMLNTGYLVTSVVDIINNDMHTAILDSSTVCHLPNILYSKHRYDIIDGFLPNEATYTYRLAGSTCYAGDIFGDYSFDTPLTIGSKIVFCNTAQYTMVKSNMFNGIPFPSLVFYTKRKGLKVVKQYKYNVFESII